MTAVVGFITRGGVIIGTDSQLTDVGNGFKMVDGTKVFEIRFKNGVFVILGRAGSVEGSDLFHEAFEDLAATTEVVSDRTVPDTVGAALLQVRTNLQKSLRGSLLSLKQKQQHFADRAHSFLIAYAFKGEMHLLEGNSNSPTASKAIRPPIATGSGSFAALTALKEVDTEGLSFQEGVGWAAYAVEMAKDLNPYCAGHTQIGAVAKDGTVAVLGPVAGKAIDSITQSIMREMREQLKKKIKTDFRDVPVPLTDAESSEWIDRELQKYLKKRANT